MRDGFTDSSLASEVDKIFGASRLKTMSQFDTTLFKNIYDKEWTGYFGNEPYKFKTGEERQMVSFIAKHLAKHLIDLILQEKHGVKNTLIDSPLRKDLMVQILPEEAERANIKPLTQEEKERAIEDVLNRQADTIKQLQGKTEHLEGKLEEKNILEEKVRELEKQLQRIVKEKPKKEKKMGRPKKILPVSPAPESPEN